jgi:hypothetical protein
MPLNASLAIHVAKAKEYRVEDSLAIVLLRAA